MFDLLLPYLLARWACWRIGYPDGLKASIRQLAPLLRRRAWIEYHRQFRVAFDATETYVPQAYRSGDAAMIYGCLRIPVYTDTFIYDVYLVEQRQAPRRGPAAAIWVRAREWREEAQQLTLYSDALAHR